MNDFDLSQLQFDQGGIIPAVVQDIHSGEVLMLAYVSRESLEKTVQSGETWFYSRSRKGLWHKGETSGNKQTVKRISVDCDGDALLVQVEQTGNACHTGNRSCFYRTPYGAYEEVTSFGEVMASLLRRIEQRKLEMPENSYTTHLFRGGLDKMLKKIGEEATETIVAAKNHDAKEIAWEVSDLLYHTLVMLAQEGVSLEAIAAELGRRAQKKKR